MKQVGRAALIADFNRVAEDLGEKPTLTEYNEHGEYSSTPIYKRFESFEALKEAAGFETGEKKIADETLVEDLQRVAGEIGHSPTVMEYREHGEHNRKSFARRWDNWHGSLVAAGLEPTEHSEHFEDQSYVEFDKEYGTVEFDCDYCGGVGEARPYRLEHYENNYCSPECQYAVLTEQTGEDARSWSGGKVTIECEVCGVTKKVKRAEKDKSRFCSQGCMLEWRSETFVGENHQRWKDNTKELYYGSNWPEQREKARKRDSHECQVCGMDEATHVSEFGSAHDVHHIVKFRTFGSYKEANKLENLITLCMRCHQHVENGNTTVPKAIWHRNKNRKVAR